MKSVICIIDDDTMFRSALALAAATGRDEERRRVR
jgi:hypothetical protein